MALEVYNHILTSRPSLFLVAVNLAAPLPPSFPWGGMRSIQSIGSQFRARVVPSPSKLTPRGRIAAELTEERKGRYAGRGACLKRSLTAFLLQLRLL